MFVDLQNDVAAADVVLAARENYRSVEHLKRYTTAGMATDQGKTSNVNALVLLGQATGRKPAEVGTTKFRPPFKPVTLNVLAGGRRGDRFRPRRELPAEAWHRERGAVFEDHGFMRPEAYPQPGETVAQAAEREALAVRRTVGVFDASPLGKLEVFGPDAAAFLDLMFIGTPSTLAPGRSRYALRLNENGSVADDGIVTRLAEHRFFVNASSAGVEATHAAFEQWLQCEFTGLRVAIVPVTEQWANLTVAGPRAWTLLQRLGLGEGADGGLAPKIMPHMSLRHAVWKGAPLRVLRASFSGELSYEINLPPSRANAMLAALWSAGTDLGVCGYGIEALDILRAEKGYIHVGTDSDGTTLPGDLGLAGPAARKTVDFIGRRSLSTPAARDPRRLQLVGLEPLDGRSHLPVGAQVLPSDPPCVPEGHVTTSVFSPVLGRPIALALLRGGMARLGEPLRLLHLGRWLEARAVAPCFFDPQGERIDGE